MMTGWPHRCAIRSVRIRASASSVDPGGNGTITFTSRDGYASSATAGTAHRPMATSAANDNVRNPGIVFLSRGVDKPSSSRQLFQCRGQLPPARSHTIGIPLALADDRTEQRVLRQCKRKPHRIGDKPACTLVGSDNVIRDRGQLLQNVSEVLFREVGAPLGEVEDAAYAAVVADENVRGVEIPVHGVGQDRGLEL